MWFFLASYWNPAPLWFFFTELFSGSESGVSGRKNALEKLVGFVMSWLQSIYWCPWNEPTCWFCCVVCLSGLWVFVGCVFVSGDSQSLLSFQPYLRLGGGFLKNLFIFTPDVWGLVIPNLTFAYSSDGLVKNHQPEEDGSSFLWLHIFWMQELLISRVVDGYFVSAMKEQHDPLHVLQFHLKLSWRISNIYIYIHMNLN